jgi:guanylate kinase
MAFSVSYTTRNKRNSEVEAKDYYFVSRDRFEEMIQNDEFIEWAEVHGNLYGTAKSEVEKKAAGGDLLLDIDVQGAGKIKENRRDAAFIFILPPLYHELRTRLEKRGQNSAHEIQRRLEVARQEIKHYREFDYLVVNDDLDTAAEELKSVILSQRCRRENREKEITPILRSFGEGD